MRKNNYIAIGIALGLCFGASIGKIMFGNMATGISVFMLLGVCFGIIMKKNK
ncbi:MAG: hypothetical protein LUH63_02380 [Parabacteroides sp.]|nr:hypothetical protein [Parabacteroides sp.]